MKVHMPINVGDGPMSSVPAYESDVDRTGVHYGNPLNDFLLQFPFNRCEVCPELVSVAHNRSQEVVIVLANVN